MAPSFFRDYIFGGLENLAKILAKTLPLQTVVSLNIFIEAALLSLSSMYFE